MENIKAILLAAGFGKRLRPYTDNWPKCLMPIKGHPLLEYWLTNLEKNGIRDILINTHYLSRYVEEFIAQSRFKNLVSLVHEPVLLGTGGTIRSNSDFVNSDTVFLAHADNWTCCNMSEFFEYHQKFRPRNTLITMMTFKSKNPSQCGIVELDKDGIVQNFHEKKNNPPGFMANSAIYLLEAEVVKWISNNADVKDFSTQVIPNFIGKIATWENKKIQRDIGSIDELIRAQNDNCNYTLTDQFNNWQKEFQKNPIHELLENVTS